MPCDPANNNIGVGGIPPLPLPGFGLPFAPITVPAPGFELPEGFPESILDLLTQLRVPWPGFNEILPFLDDISNTLLKALSDMFSQIAPFLALYNFFIALLNMILCIIEVLCALPNPFATIRAVIRLIKTCLPAFLNLFPWLALLAMILSIIALLLALVAYIISRILAFVEDLLRNIGILVDGLSFSDGEATAAAIVKIASLLCLIDNLIAIFSSLGAIIAIIQALAQIPGRTVCAGSGNGQGDDSQCCSDDVCPPFIVENPDGIQGEKGKLIYYNASSREILSFIDFNNNSFGRTEKWQFVNDDPDQEVNSQFRQIITRQLGPTDFFGFEGYELGDIFWPEGQVFGSDSSLRRTPYVVDIVLENFDPGPFVTNDLGGSRDFVIKNTIVNIKPYIGVDEFDNVRRVQNFDGTVVPNETGTLRLVGGSVFELDDDGNETAYFVNGQQASLESFISQDPTVIPSTTVNLTDDAYTISDVTFNLRINHAALVYYDLIVYGCIPIVRQEIDLANLANGDVSAVIQKVSGDSGLPILPDVSGTVQCLNTAIAKLRSNITTETVEEFQADAIACTDAFTEEAGEIYCRVLKASVDPFNSEFTLTPAAQFVTKEIKIEITLRDRSGLDIGQNIPENCQAEIIELLDIVATFGEVSDISYENNKFVATIVSDQGGSGTLTVSFDGNVISRIVNLDTLASPTAAENIQLPYEFVGIRARNSTVSEPDDKQRRDAGDVSRGE